MKLVIACPTLLGHLQDQGISGRLRPLSVCLAMYTNGLHLSVAWRSTSEIYLSFSDTPSKGWTIY